MGSVSAVCRRWRRVAKDDSLWRPLHMAVLGHQRTLPWMAATRRAWPTLSKGFITTMHRYVVRLLSPECQAKLVALPLQPLASAVAVEINDRDDEDEDQELSWHDAFALKAGHTRRFLKALSMLERIPHGASVAYRWIKPGELEDWCCAVMLCCDRVIDRMLLLYKERGWARKSELFQRQTLMLAAITGARNVAQARTNHTQLNAHARTRSKLCLSLSLSQAHPVLL
jgi:hypothetical protein